LFEQNRTLVKKVSNAMVEKIVIFGTPWVENKGKTGELRGLDAANVQVSNPTSDTPASSG
jgi:hypothetical protein